MRATHWVRGTYSSVGSFTAFNELMAAIAPGETVLRSHVILQATNGDTGGAPIQYVQIAAALTFNSEPSTTPPLSKPLDNPADYEYIGTWWGQLLWRPQGLLWATSPTNNVNKYVAEPPGGQIDTHAKRGPAVSGYNSGYWLQTQSHDPAGTVTHTLKASWSILVANAA